jgi:hypothetical protein
MKARQDQLPLVEQETELPSVEEIDAVTAKCNAYLDKLAAAEKSERPGLAVQDIRRMLMAGYTSPINAVRALLLKDEQP